MAEPWSSDDVMRRLLTTTRTWAVVGWSPRPDRPSNRVARFLEQAGFDVHPVNPEAVGPETGLAHPCVATLGELPEAPRRRRRVPSLVAGR